MKKHIGLFITGFLAVAGIVVDNSMRWRSEMEYRDYDRQTRLLENIMIVKSFDERKALIDFYLSLDAFSSPIKERMISFSEQRPPERPVPTFEKPWLNVPDFSLNAPVPVPKVEFPAPAPIPDDEPFVLTPDAKVIPRNIILPKEHDVFNNAELANGLRSLRNERRQEIE